MLPVPAEWATYVHKHNVLAAFTAELVTAADEASTTTWAVENPADYGDPSRPAWWARFARHATIWLLPKVREALTRAGAAHLTFAQCALGAQVRKYTTLVCGSALRGCWARCARPAAHTERRGTTR
eukprot:5261455-Pleurochrysis_carterae.AAC.1